MEPQMAHSALDPAGASAAQIARLFYTYLDVSAVVFALVIGALGLALSRIANASPRRTGENRARPSSATNRAP